MPEAHDLAVYVTSIHEVIAGILLVAVTLAIHGFGMPLTVRVHGLFDTRLERTPSFALGVGALILSSWIVIAVHLLEVLVWALFFLWKHQFPNLSLAYYFALNEYTTLGSEYDLKSNWRLLEGMLATAGLLAFAWSTGVLLTMAQRLQDRQLEAMSARRQKRPAPPG